MKGSLCRLAETSFLWRDTAMRIRERFNPRAPCGARRYLPQGIRYPHKISTHAPLAGRDGDGGRGSDAIAYFNPRAPCGARPDFGEDIDNCPKFQPTRPLRGATPTDPSRGRPLGISTHAPLAGRDSLRSTLAKSDVNFNPRAPCGARLLLLGFPESRFDFNPRAPCGARRHIRAGDGGSVPISTHAPLAGRDLRWSCS